MHSKSRKNVVRPLAAFAAAVLLTGSSLSAVVAKEKVYTAIQLPVAESTGSTYPFLDPIDSLVEIDALNEVSDFGSDEYPEHMTDYSAIQLPAVFDHEEHDVAFEAINSINAPLGSSLSGYPLDHEEHNVALEAINTLNALPDERDDEE